MVLGRVGGVGSGPPADYIVTGDDHLLKLAQFATVMIVKAAEFIEILAQTEGRNRP